MAIPTPSGSAQPSDPYDETLHRLANLSDNYLPHIIRGARDTSLPTEVVETLERDLPKEVVICQLVVLKAWLSASPPSVPDPQAKERLKQLGTRIEGLVDKLLAGSR